MEHAIELVSTHIPSAIRAGLRGRRRHRNNNHQADEHRDDANNNDTQPVEEQRRDDPEHQWQPRRRSSLENECPICSEVLFPMDKLVVMDAVAAAQEGASFLLSPPQWLRQWQQHQRHHQRQQAQRQQELRHSIHNRRCGHRICSLCYDNMRRTAEEAARSLICPMCRGAMDRLRDETTGRNLPVTLPVLTMERAWLHGSSYLALVIPVVMEIPAKTVNWVFETGPLTFMELLAYFFIVTWGLDSPEFTPFEKKITAAGSLVTLSVLYFMDWHGWVLRSMCRCIVLVAFCLLKAVALMGFYQGAERFLLWWREHQPPSTWLKATIGVLTVGLVTSFQWWMHFVWFGIRVATIYVLIRLLVLYNTLVE